MFLRAHTASEGGWGQPLRLRLSRRASGFLGGLALLIGFVLVTDAVITVTWQEPFTAVFAQEEQKALSKKLAAAEKAPLPPSTFALVKGAGTEGRRMALLAGHMRVGEKAGEPLGRIAIAKIHAKYVFVSGTGVDSLKKGPGHYAGTALPGERGTVAIAGHRTTYAAPFRHLDKIHRGDAITLTMAYGNFSYRVEGSRVVSPSKTSVLRHVRHDRLVLTTCTPLGSAAKRIVVTARLKHSTPRGQAIHLVPIAPSRVTVAP
jgi:sortase A